MILLYIRPAKGVGGIGEVGGIGPRQPRQVRPQSRQALAGYKTPVGWA